MLNERFDAFSHFIDSGDTNPPTKSQMEVFQKLSGQLDEQLKKWTQIKADDLPKVSGMIKQLELPALMLPPDKTAAPKDAKSS
jgi:hypothetical protein